MKVYYDDMALMFSYGMNTNRTLMQLRCKDAVPFAVGYMDYCLLNFRYHLDVEVSLKHKHCVHGVIWQLSEEDMELIDQIEGYPEYYTRQRQTIYIVDPRHPDKLLLNRISAWVYDMETKTDLELPDERYYNIVREGYEQNGIPIKQLQDALDRCSVRLEI